MFSFAIFQDSYYYSFDCWHISRSVESVPLCILFVLEYHKKNYSLDYQLYYFSIIYSNLHNSAAIHSKSSVFYISTISDQVLWMFYPLDIHFLPSCSYYCSTTSTFGSSSSGFSFAAKNKASSLRESRVSSYYCSSSCSGVKPGFCCLVRELSFSLLLFRQS